MISIIVPSYNSENTISNCLDSLEDQSFKGDFEIIVVDSSYDRTPEIVDSDYPAVKLIRLNKRTDPGRARNIGIGEARGDLIAFIDADCVAAHDWLERMAGAHDSSHDIVGGIVRNSPESNNLVGRAGYMAEFRGFLPGRGREEVTHIPTCNISYKKRVFREFGMFQGKYYPQEDLIFNYGLWKQGEKILLDPTIQVWHHHRSGLDDFLYHQHRIGKATSKVLRTIPLEGSFIARRPLLAMYLMPFMTLVKFMRTIRVFLRYQPKFITERPLVLPIFALGLVAWAIGFVGSAYAKTPLPQEKAK
jgi:glycosyltransferase involved in cell wall biosynthesis